MEGIARLLSGILARIFLMGYTIFIIVKAAKLKNTSGYYSYCTFLLLNLAELVLFTGVLRVCSSYIKSAEKRIALCVLIFLICTWPLMWIMEEHYVEGLKKFRKYFPRNFTKFWKYCNREEYQQIFRIEKRDWELAGKRKFYLLEANYLCCAMIARFFSTLSIITLNNVNDVLIILVCNATDALDLVQNLSFEIKPLFRSQIRSILFVVHLSQLLLCLKRTSLLRKEAPNGRKRDGDLPWKVLDLILPVLLQDLPFLCVRLTMFSHFKTSTLRLPFYTIKNIVFIALQCLRVLIVIVLHFIGL